VTPPQTSDSAELYRIAFVCLGNICRSPMAHVVLERRLAEVGLDDHVVVTSAGTGGWHTGEPMDRRAAAVLTGAGYDPSRHIARRFSMDWYVENDLLLAMDASNYADMAELAPDVESQKKLRMFRDFDPEATDADRDVPDPWYRGTTSFNEVLQMVERTTESIIDHVREALR
jgi:protein-tyrosine phosphatase